MPNKLDHLTINEVSLVDSPANSEKINGRKVQRATVALFKRDLSAALWDSEDVVCKAVDGPDEGVAKDGKTYNGVAFPKSDFAYAPDDVPSNWKLRLTATPGGAPDAAIVGAAVAALGKGFRGKKVQIPAEALAGVKAKVRAAWKAANEGKDIAEMPAILKGETTMTLEQIEKKLAETDVVIKSLTEDRDFAKNETETVLKMSKGERKLYAGMDAEKRKAYMAADPEKRKEMMEACSKAKKEKAAEDEMDEATQKRFRAAGPVEKAAMLAIAKAEAEKKKKDKPSKDDPSNDDEEPDDDDLEKREMVTKLAATEDRVEKAERELAAITKKNRVLEFTKRAESELPHTPGTPVEKGEQLMTLAEAFGGEASEGFKKYMAGAKAADEAFKSQFAEIGKGGGADIPALKRFDAAVSKIAKHEKISIAKATERVMLEQPELYSDYERDQHAFAARR